MILQKKSTSLARYAISSRYEFLVNGKGRSNDNIVMYSLFDTSLAYLGSSNVIILSPQIKKQFRLKRNESYRQMI